MRTAYQRAYSVWNSIKSRCYNTNDKCYYCYGAKGVVMCDEWLDFKTFKAWYDENYYEVDGEYMAIDKDILGGNTKIYSPETCIIIPFKINGMFVHKENEFRGVQKKGNSKYEVKVRNPISGKNEYHGTYSDPNIAVAVYNECKEAIVRGVALEYKDKLPDRIFHILYNFKF